jgi:hypothetical protein
MKKNCAHCAKPFGPEDLGHPGNFTRQKYCSKPCMHAGRRAEGISIFWSYVDKNGPGGCWIWTGYRNERGYGLMCYEGRKNIRAHRFSWELVHGKTAGWCLHKCDVRRCVNPDHMYIGTARDNMVDKVSRRRDPRVLFSADEIREIRRMCASGARNKDVIAKFPQAHQGTVWQIKVGRIYSWVK